MGCSVPECKSAHYSKGFCRVHYVRNRRHGDPLHVGKPGPVRHTCTIPGCEGQQVGQGLCDKHYRRKRRYGDPLAVKRIIGDIEARWWSYVDRRADDECWPWTGSITTHGYGEFWDGSHVAKAHLWGYARFVRPVPEGSKVDHRCHDPKLCTVPHRQCPHRACVNYLSHLEPVTNRVNVLRGARTVLPDNVVVLLMEAHRQTGVPVAELARIAGVDKTTLYRRFHRLA